jgi:hypothetical protein
LDNSDVLLKGLLFISLLFCANGMGGCRMD